MFRVRSLMTRTTISVLDRFGGATRSFGGGPRNEEHKLRMRAVRKARKMANIITRKPKLLKPIIDPETTKIYKDLCAYKTHPIPHVLQKILPQLETFLVQQWLPSYPKGARLRKFQRDVAFRLPREFRPGKLPLEQLMTAVGHFERKGLLRTKAGTGGKLVIHRPDSEVFFTFDFERPPVVATEAPGEKGGSLEAPLNSDTSSNDTAVDGDDDEVEDLSDDEEMEDLSARRKVPSLAYKQQM